MTASKRCCEPFGVYVRVVSKAGDGADEVTVMLLETCEGWCKIVGEVAAEQWLCMGVWVYGCMGVCMCQGAVMLMVTWPVV